MPGSRVIRRGLFAAAALLGVVAAGFAVFIAGADRGHFRGVLLGYLERSTGRRLTVGGALQVHLFSLHPYISARDVTIGNPPWTAAGDTAHIDALSVMLTLPRPGRPGRIDRLRLEGARLTLTRDAAGHANWQRHNPDKTAAQALPLIGALAVPNAEVVLDDQRRHLKFRGTVSTEDARRADGSDALQIQGSGELNEHPVTFELTGDPLATASHDHPYRFSFTENSSGSQLKADGALPKPFDFNVMEAGFDAAGDDLKDLYFLTGATLVNTGRYRLTGYYSRQADHSRFADLKLVTGQSDLAGSVDIDASSRRTRSNAKLAAQELRLADFGLRAAGREANPPTLLFSNVAVNPAAMRLADAVVDVHARRMEVGRQVLENFSGKLTLERGVATAAPLSGGFLGGTFSGKVKLDATHDSPLATVDLMFSDLQLAQWPHQGSEPPFDGKARARVQLRGRGASIHEVAASAEGSAGLWLPQGSVRASLAELSGLDLRGIGLTLEKNKSATQVRCAAVNFLAHEGIFDVQQLVIDTEPVRIGGEGSIHMDAETLDMIIRGEPKSMRVLRLKAPLLIRGTLAHPTFGIEKGDSKLLLVDRGHGRDEDCAALIR